MPDFFRSLAAAMAPKHRADRHEDACSLACEAGFEDAGNCGTYVGRHRAEVWA